MSRVLIELERFRSLSEDMFRAAEAQEWDKLARTGKERSALFAALPPDLATTLPYSDLAKSRAIVEHCLFLDRQIQGLAEERQKALRILLREPAQ